MLQHLGGAQRRSAHTFQHLGNPRRFDPVGDLQRRQLRVLDHRRQQVLIDKVCLAIEPHAGDAMALDDAFLKPAARGLRRLAVGDVRKNQHEAEHAVARRLHGIGAYHQRHVAIAGAAQHQLAAPASFGVEQLTYVPGEPIRRLEGRRKIVEFRRFCGTMRQQGLERRIHKKNFALHIGDDDRLLADTHMAGELFELVLHDQCPHRAELQHDIGHRLRDRARGREIRLGPRIGRALDDLMPLREGASRRQIFRCSADHKGLHRIAAPRHRADALGAKPDQIFARIVRDRRGDDAARDLGEIGKIRHVVLQGRRRDHLGTRQAVEPFADRANVLGAGHLAGGDDLTFIDQRAAAGSERLQDRLRGIEDCGPPVAIT